MVIVLLAIIAGIAAPSFRDWKRNADLNADMRQLYAFFQQARNNAVRQNATCSITFGETVAGQTFDYVSFVDANGNNTLDVDDVVIYSGNLTTGVANTDNTLPVNDGGLPTLAFSSRGLPQGNNGANFLGGTIELTAETGNKHALVINRFGRMRID